MVRDRFLTISPKTFSHQVLFTEVVNPSSHTDQQPTPLAQMTPKTHRLIPKFKITLSRTPALQSESLPASWVVHSNAQQVPSSAAILSLQQPTTYFAWKIRLRQPRLVFVSIMAPKNVSSIAQIKFLFLISSRMECKIIWTQRIFSCMTMQ